MKLLAALIVSLLIGCGNGVFVTVHEISATEMQNRFGDVWGEAVWNGLWNECDIYLMPVDEYQSEQHYLETRGHEDRHCFEGHWHEE